MLKSLFQTLSLISRSFKGEYYVAWLECMVKLRAIESNNNFARVTWAHMNMNANLLGKSEFLHAAKYIDPRFNFMGSSIFSVETQTRVQVTN